MSLRTTTRELVGRQRGNEPLGAAMVKSGSSGVGLTTDGINAWLANIFNTPMAHRHLEQYSKSVPVYFAVKLRADSVARAPLKAYRPMGDRGDLEWVGARHPVQRSLDAMNPWWSQANFIRASETYLSLWGSAFWWVNKVGSDPQNWEMWLLRPDKMVVVKDPQSYIRGFVYDQHGANFPMLPDEVVWHRYFNPMDEFTGLSPLEPLKDLLAMRQSMISTNGSLFKHGILTQNLAFLLKNSVNSEQVEEFYARMEARHAGGMQRPIVMGQADGDVKNLGLTNREMEWADGLRWAAGEVLTALGVREELYPGSQRTTYHNLGEADRSFWRHTIAPEWAMLQSDLDEQFGPMLPTRYQDLVYRFDTLTVEGMQESIDSKSTRTREDVKAGILTPDEARASVWGLPPLPDGMGEKPYVPSGSTPLDALEEEGEPEPTPPMLEPPTPDDDDDDDGRAVVAEVRCPTCSKRLPLNNVPVGSEAYCKRCSATFEVR